MKFFSCVLDTAARGVDDRTRRRMEAVARQRRLQYAWQRSNGAAVLTAWDDLGGDVSVEATDRFLAVGDVRLDNRLAIVALLRSYGIGYGEEPSDLRLVLDLVSRDGRGVIQKLVGDFAFVLWNEKERVAIGACDILSVRRLYFAQREGSILFGSRAEPLAMSDEYDLAYLGDVLTFNYTQRDRTPYAGVNCLRSASTIVAREQDVQIQRYWNPAAFQSDASLKANPREAISQCRELLATSIGLRLDPTGRTWAQLSGGLDSSTIVSTAQWLAQRNVVSSGLAGALTFVDGSQTGADEREYSDAVVNRWGVRNELVVDPPWWFDDDGASIPIPDLPIMGVSNAPLYRRSCDILRRTGARVLLTGHAGDQLFTGDWLYFADELAKGRIGYVFGEMAHIAALGRISFWNFLYRYALVPLLPAVLQRRVLAEMYTIHDWISKDTLRKVGVSLTIPDPRYAGRTRHKYQHWLISELEWVDRYEDWAPMADVVSVRHPFVYRPLVEFALRLPPQLCAQPHARKWILREAMRGILPEAIRTRVGKGGGGDSVPRMYIDHAPLFRKMLKESVLAELGLVDLSKLMRAVERTINPQNSVQVDAARTLSVEAWLQMRAGRWSQFANVAPRATSLAS